MALRRPHADTLPMAQHKEPRRPGAPRTTHLPARGLRGDSKWQSSAPVGTAARLKTPGQPHSPGVEPDDRLEGLADGKQPGDRAATTQYLSEVTLLLRMRFSTSRTRCRIADIDGGRELRDEFAHSQSVVSAHELRKQLNGGLLSSPTCRKLPEIRGRDVALFRQRSSFLPWE